MRPIRRLAPATLLLFIGACSTVPEETEKARGVLSGQNLVLALSVLVVVAAIGLVLGAVTLDRMVRTRRQLTEGPPVVEEEEVEPEDEVVAGIGVGRAAVPRWLYGAYALIPVFAFAYIFTNIAPEPAAEAPAETPAAGPCEECEIAASGIKFDKDALEVAAESEITVTFNNNDNGIPHDFSVYDAEEPSGEPLEKTPVITGTDTAEMSFTSAPAGETWSFNCTIHPGSMIGTIDSVEG